MSIKLPRDLPAAQEVRAEGIAVVERFDEPPLRVLLLNLMPQKAATEGQFARLLGATGLPVELTLSVPASYTPTTTAPAHLDSFYVRWPRLRDDRFDALIVTGAPVEHLPFEAVSYWRELEAVLDWAESNVTASLFICWAAQAALWHRHGVPKRPLPAKMFGVFPQLVLQPHAEVLRGFGQSFLVPVSRHTEVLTQDLPRQVAVLAASVQSGLCLLEERARRAHYMFNHFEYGAGTLAKEYERDRAAGRPIALPRNYFPGDDPAATPVNTWQPHARMFFANWLGRLARERREPADGPMMQWLLAERRPLASLGNRFLDLLIAALSGPEALPGVLHTLAAFSLSPRALRVHRRGDGGALIECRTDALDEPAAERLAQRLGALPQVHKLAYRSSSGAGGVVRADHSHGTAAVAAAGAQTAA